MMRYLDIHVQRISNKAVPSALQFTRPLRSIAKPSGNEIQRQVVPRPLTIFCYLLNNILIYSKIWNSEKVGY